MMGGGARMARLGRRRGGSVAEGWVGVRGRVWRALSRAVRRGGAGEAFVFWCGWIGSADCLWDRATCGAEARGRGETHDGGRFTG
jgi:hypothetical protein